VKDVSNVLAHTLVNLKKNRMKKMKLMVVFICVLAACRKQHQTAAENTLIGKWDWVKTPGSFGVPETPQNTGKTWTLTFNSDSTFMNGGNYMTHVIPDPAGTFSLNTGSLNPALGNGTYVTLRSPNILLLPWALKYTFTSNNTLILDSGSPVDAPAFYFERR
jgi:hypothetical protein